MKKIPWPKPGQTLSDFVGNNGSYQLIMTEDQSYTLKSLAFDEACHSMSGAYAETLHNYVNACQLVQLSQTRPKITLLEIGFGLGVGAQVTFEALQKNHQGNAHIHYIALELDGALVEFAQKNTHIHAPMYPSIKDLGKKEIEGLEVYEATKNGHQLSVIIGNARETLISAYQKGLLPTVDIIYQDAFSPRKNPELWTQEWFESLALVSANDVCMSTYCSSISPRKAMRAAGFQIQCFKGIGKKRECTLARLQGQTDPAIQALLDKSQALTLSDTNIEDYRQK